MELFRVHVGRNVGLLDVSPDLSVLLTGFRSVVWCALDMIGVMTCQHCFTQTPVVLQRTPPAAGDEHATVSCDRCGTKRGVRRGMELDRAMTGGRQ